MKISKYDREKVSRVRGRGVEVTFEYRPGGSEAVSHVCISVGEECSRQREHPVQKLLLSLWLK